ncbi:MAG: class I SAM-dependent methyltransferase [Euryarchaeota archaeon]|nr:class I SAM-dependent methyltransferase [Euryarchaeota archaeon]MDE1837537.1 class I SAM-dependent methyltransferase [Euryarchaeota archaeon]MDE1880018.1 class I SAM-dependent methyltransferase [Euryarchaeota archaeon]MDE2046153.1 class I SAM-dependent methyltransferase [Thermoplasmata archaeon]
MKRPAPSKVPPSAHGHQAHHHHGGGPGWSVDRALEALESPERRRILDPESLWREVGLLPGSVVADVGAGTGYFATPAAQRVGAKGAVYAIDVSSELVNYLSERGRREKLPWLHPVRSTVEKIPLPSGVADVVLLATVLHDVPDPTVAEAVRLLRPGGCFVNLDWSKQETPWGPPLEIRLSPEEAASRLSAFGLKVVRTWDLGPHHYGQLLRRREEPSGSEC